MLNRDARHLALAQVGAVGQQKIAAASVLVIGAGGIGCASASYLAASGVGKILLSDFDAVDASNLARQFLYTPDDVGQQKAEVAARRLREMNPDCDIVAIDERLSGDGLAARVRESDLVLDGCDNFATRFMVNNACVAARRRLISGAAIRLEGQLAVFGPDYEQQACYRCLYEEADESLENCAGNGVLSPVPGVIGTLMAVEALKSLAGIRVNTDQLTLYDASSTEFSRLRVKKNSQCPTCGAQ